MGRKKSTEYQDLIIKTSYKLFMDNGYRNVTTREIAAACGMERALLHYYFNKKDQILGEIIIFITKKSYLYLLDRLGDPVRDYVFRGLQYRLFYALIDEKPDLMNIYLEHIANGEIMLQAHMELHEWCEQTIGLHLSSKEQLITSYMVGGTSMLILEKLENQSDLSYREIAEISLSTSLSYLGYSSSRIRETLDYINEIISPSFVKEFIEHFEDCIKAEPITDIAVS